MSLPTLPGETVDNVHVPDAGQPVLKSPAATVTHAAGLRWISDATGSILPMRLRSTHWKGDPFLWSVSGPRSDLYAAATRFKWPTQTKKRMGGDVEKLSIDARWPNWRAHTTVTSIPLLPNRILLPSYLQPSYQDVHSFSYA